MSNKRDIFDKIFVIIFTLFMLIYFGHNNIFKNVLGFKLYLYQTFAILLTIICFFKCIKEKKIIIVRLQKLNKLEYMILDIAIVLF